jgi:hypothetical protein
MGKRSSLQLLTAQAALFSCEIGSPAEPAQSQQLLASLRLWRAWQAC